MSSPSFARPSLGVVLVSLLIIVALGIFGAARLAQHKGLQRVHASVEARGWGLAIEGPQTRLTGRVRVESVCISLLKDAHQDLCLDDLRIHVSPLSALRGRLSIGSVSAAKLRLNTNAERIQQLRQRTEREESDDKDSAQSRRLESLDRLRIEEVSIQFGDAERGLTALLHGLRLNADPNGWELHADGELRAFEGVDELFGAALNGLTGKPFELSSYWDRDESHLRDASVMFSEQVSVSLPLREQVEIKLDGVAFEHPYALRLLTPSAELPQHAMRIQAAAIETEVGQWTMYLPDFYLASMTIEAPIVDVPTSKARETLAMLKSLSAEILDAHREALESAAAASENHASDDSTKNDATKGESAAAADDESKREVAQPARGLKAELARRNWYEVVPRAIHVENASIRFHSEGQDDALLRLDALSLKYGLRVLQRQIDIEIDGELRFDGEDAGTIAVQTEWDYERKIARVSWKLAALDLVALRSLLPSERLELHSGRLHLDGRLRTAKSPQLSGEHTTRVEGLHLTHPRLQESLKVQHAAVSGPILLEREGARTKLSLRTQALELEEAKAELSLVFTDFRLLQKPRASKVDVLFEVADQPAMRLFSSIPASLRGPVADAKMSGSWGLTLGFQIDQTGFLDDGRPLWEIGNPSVYQLRDQQLALTSLPDAVDVRRLNGAMNFTFRGANDSVMRELYIPSSRPDLDDGVHHDDAYSNGWVPLRAMSYYFVATQLYREDGSFFRNTGINWLQLRRVLSEALTTRELSRGASTITMQTVKNVFLSHERSIERKLQELFLAYWMTRAVPKARILEVYLNIIELGPNRNGADEASRFHFRTSIRDLELRESVWLSSISPNPVRIGGTQPKGEVPLGACVRCDRLIEGLYAREWLNASEHRAGLGGALAPAALPFGVPSEGTLPFDLQGGMELETPPLFDLLRDESDVAPNAIERLPLTERVDWWIKQSRPTRGTSATNR